MLTSSGVLLIASWLVLSLGQGYYSMMLFPFLMTVVLPQFGDPQLAGVAGDLRVHDDGPLAAVALADHRARVRST